MDSAVGFTEMMPDDKVINKILDGDVAIFEILIRRYNGVLYRIGRTFGFNHHDTEDLMQETHIAAYMQLKSFENRSSYKTYISRIMINKCIYKTKYGYFRNELPVVETPGSDEADINEDVVINRELSIILEKSLEQLPVNYRSVFILREVEGFSVSDTAALLNITPVNVKVRLNRAKALLQKQIERFYSRAEVYSFNLIYCDDITQKTLHALRRVLDYKI
jgi:RNA polymerase sigma factor (sigma-70 family)